MSEAKRRTYTEEFKTEAVGLVRQPSWGGIGKSIPFAGQDWVNTRAAYRFFANERITEQDIRDRGDRAMATG